MPVSIHTIPALKDNYIYALLDEATRDAVVIDPGEAKPVVQWLGVQNANLRAIFNTHHHWDHTNGNVPLRERYECEIYGYGPDAERILAITQQLHDGEIFSYLGLNWEVMAVPGHTLGHIAYYIAELDALFCGDTLFSCGCGRMFEGTAPMMQHSLARLRGLPDDTKVYCTHEYTQSNLAFVKALEPELTGLDRFEGHVSALRKAGRPSLPSRLGDEKRFNPFLRWDDPKLRKVLEMELAQDHEVFAELRARKDRF